MANNKNGNLHMIDDLTSSDRDRIAGTIKTYADAINNDKHGLHWIRAVRNIENILFTHGRQYVGDLLTARLANSSTTGLGDLSVIKGAVSNIPQPTNDLLGRYVETNIALLTENRPRPRVTPKSDRDEDQTAAELSELTLEHLWEALSMPQKMRDIARLVLHTGLALLEVAWDPTVPRRIQVPKTQTEIGVELPEGAIPPELMASREVPVLEGGRPVFEEKVEYGDLAANIVSTFQFHTPASHYWENLGWVLKEEFVSIDTLRDKYLTVPKQEAGLTKEKGWYLEALDDIAEENISSLALWWWERISELVEGPGPSLYIGAPDNWKGHTVVRTFDRAPSMKWPKGRTIITVGGKVLYDSPKKIGARAYDARWPNRWHPYIRYRWEAATGSIYGRSLISKLLPKIKRVNSIDTTLIMWRRTVPIASWIIPKGTNPIEDLWSGHPALIMEYDARRTASAAPSPVYPPPFPAGMMQERDTQIAEMEAIAGTEEVLRGQRPVGVTCWVEGSELTDANGLPIEVKDIKIGDEHVSMKGIGPIGASHSRPYSGEVIKISSWGNLSTTVTPNHKFPVIPSEAIFRKKCGNRKQNKKTNKCIKPSFDSVTTKYAYEINSGDYLLSGFNRPKDGVEKINIMKYGGIFKTGCGGVQHGQSKINEEQLITIREKLNSGITGKNIASEYNISEAAVSRIKHNITYTSLGKTRGKELPPYIVLNEDILWLMGMYLAEGQVAYSKIDNEPAEVRWTLHKDEEFTLGKKLKDIIFRNFNIKAKLRRRRDAKAIDICISNRAFARLMLALFNTGSNKKYIHPDVFRTPNSLLPLVAGWSDGDGSLDSNTIRITTVSKKLASQIRSILLDEKIYATISVSKYKDNQRQYKICVSGFDAENITKFSARWTNFISIKNSDQGRRGFWCGDLYASKVNKLNKYSYEGNVYNVTMNELSGLCDNSVNTFGLFVYQSALMVDILRKQALASRSAILQEWDESHQELGTLLLQTTIRHVKDDPRYLERIRILAREKHSRVAIEAFSGSDLSDNVIVRVDTASMALVSKEAREAKMIEVLQYLPNLASIEDIGLRQAVLDELGLKKSLVPSGPDVDRARKMISLIKQNRFERIFLLPEDDPYIFRALLVNESKNDGFIDLAPEQQNMIIQLIEVYDRQIKLRELQQQQLAIAQMEMAAKLKGEGKE